MADPKAIQFLEGIYSRVDKQVREIVTSMLPNMTVAAQDDGTVIANDHRIVNFQGPGVVVSDDAAMRRVNVFVPGAPTASSTSNVLLSSTSAKCLNLWTAGVGTGLVFHQTISHPGFNPGRPDTGWLDNFAVPGINLLNAYYIATSIDATGNRDFAAQFLYSTSPGYGPYFINETMYGAPYSETGPTLPIGYVADSSTIVSVWSRSVGYPTANHPYIVDLDIYADGAGSGSGNNAPPSGWQLPGYSDSSWATPVVPTGGSTGTNDITGSACLWPTSAPASATAEALFRQSFTISAGTITSATLTIEADDKIVSAYLDGTYLGTATGTPGTSVGKIVFSVSPALLTAGTHVLAVHVANLATTTTGAAWVAYGLSVQTSTAGTDSRYIPYAISDAKGDLIAGTGADTAARLPVGTNGYVLMADSTQTTGLKWGAAAGGGGGGSASLLLDYAASTDIASGVSVSADTWTDLGTAQSFTVTSATSLILITARGGVFLRQATGGQFSVAARLNIDGSASKILGQWGDSYLYDTAGGQKWGASPLNGAAGVVIGTLSAASHTVKVQVYSRGFAATMYCRASSFPVTEGLGIQVLQLP